MKPFLSHAAAAIAIFAGALPQVAGAQSSPSAYTSATRYDAVGRVTGTIAPDPDGGGALKHSAVRTTYDGRGLPIRVESGELSSWPNELIAPVDWTGFVIHTIAETTFDALDRKVFEKVSGVNGAIVTPISLIQYSYDNRGRLECTAVRMNPAAWTSLPTSACILGVQGSYGPDRITRTVYDAAGQVLQIRKAVGTPIEIADVTYSYTPNGKISHVIDANGNRAALRYDGHDRQSRWVFPSKTRPTAFNASSPETALATAGALNEADYEQYTYDANGNRTALRKRDGWTISYLYDALNRVTRKTLPARTDLASTHRRNVFYEYDLHGLQTKARFGSISGAGITYTYDGFGRLASETQSTDGTSRTVSSIYDANGNRIRVTHPDAAYFTFEFDGVNRFTRSLWWNPANGSTTQFATTTYSNRGLPSVFNLANVWTNYAYDPAGRLNQVSHDFFAGAAADVTWTFTRNPASQILTETQSNDLYSWDGHVNLTRAYTTNGLNQYETAGNAAFCHDANGNLTADGTSVYKYDVENRLVEKRVQGAGNTNCASLVYTGALQASLKYDPTGRLFEVSGGAAGVQRFVYDGNALIAEYNSAGIMLRRYIHGINAEADDALVQFSGSAIDCPGTRFLQTDPRGSVIALADCWGNHLMTNTYDEYGIPDTASGNDIATKGRFRYTGQAWIPELGMYYYKARVYSPTLGRFLQTDPIGYEDQFNLYAYAHNDPVNLVDFDGQCAGPLIIPCGIAAEKAILGITTVTVAVCVGSGACKAASDAIQEGIERLTPDRTPTARREARPASSERTANSGPRGGTASEAQRGVGKDGRKSNPDRKAAAEAKFNEAMKELERARAEPPGPGRKEKIKAAEKQRDHWRRKRDELSEPHNLRGERR